MICIAGMPRSGTSLVTQLLHRCGVDLGRPEELMPASNNNTDGFWENLRFVRLNEKLLAANGGTWFAPPPAIEPTPELTAEAQSIIDDFEGREPWAWKDPRNAITLPFWKSLLPSMKVLLCVRHPAETASSLAASTLIPRRWFSFYWPVTRPGSLIRLRDGSAAVHERVWGAARTAMSRRKRCDLIDEVALELWRIYNTSVLEATSELDRLVTHYEAVLSNPRAELGRILDFAGIRIAPDALDEITRVVSSRLRHQRAEAAELPPSTARLYARLSGEGKDPRTASNISA